MSAATNFHIRPFRDDDREAIVEIGNRDRPAHRQNTAASWARRDTLRKPEIVDIRLCVADPHTDRAIAFLSAADLNTTGFKMKDVCEFDITVDHAYRGQGIASLLYHKATEFAAERGARRMITSFREWTPDEPAIAFLKERGFAEQERETPSYLDLTTWDESPFLGSLGQAASYGARILTYADVEDTDENRRRYYDLEKPLIYDIPRRDEQPFEFEPYEDWVKFVIERPEWRPELALLAEVDGEWIGECHVVPKLEAPTVGMQWLTGVLKDHRGHGIATALKVRAYEKARAAGITIMTTENHEDNAPMLAINKKFGFIPEPSIVVYNKVLRE
ncbi:MAG: GNAT family N-acetyltransferase [Janthinobacterium lividum]